MDYLQQLLKDQKVEWKKLGEVCRIKNGRDYKHLGEGNIPVYGSGGIMRYVDTFVYDKPTVLIPRKGSLKNLFYLDSPFWNVDTIFYTEIDTNQILPKFLYHFLTTQNLENLNMAGGVPSLTQTMLNKLPIPLPPLSVQSRIVEILDKFTALEAELEAELELRKKQYQHYREQLLNFSSTPPHEFNVIWRKLGEVAEYEQPTAYLVKDTEYKDDYPTPVLTAGKTFILGYTNETEGIYEASKHPTIIFDDFTTALRWVDFDFKAKSSAMKMITSKDESVCLLKYIYYWLCTIPSGLVEGDHKRQWISNYANKDFPLPPLSVQSRIVEILDKFDALTNSITEGLPLEIKLRRQQYEYYREQLLNFPHH